MRIKVIVFDFDGTLIDSNQLKYDAYFKLFGDSECDIQTIRAVLAEMYEKSRFDILEEILKRRGNDEVSLLKHKLNDLANRYNDIVLAGAKSCTEIPGAEMMLRFLLGKHKLYVSSTTPDVSLKEIIQFRGWGDYFVDVFGYPHHKSRTLQLIMEQEKVIGSEVMVVGDGESDREAAQENSCLFLQVNEAFNFNHFHKYIENIQHNNG